MRVSYINPSYSPTAITGNRAVKQPIGSPRIVFGKTFNVDKADAFYLPPQKMTAWNPTWRKKAQEILDRRYDDIKHSRDGAKILPYKLPQEKDIAYRNGNFAMRFNTLCACPFHAAVDLISSKTVCILEESTDLGAFMMVAKAAQRAKIFTPAKEEAFLSDIKARRLLEQRTSENYEEIAKLAKKYFSRREIAAVAKELGIRRADEKAALHKVIVTQFANSTLKAPSGLGGLGLSNSKVVNEKLREEYDELCDLTPGLKNLPNLTAFIQSPDHVPAVTLQKGFRELFSYANQMMDKRGTIQALKAIWGIRRPLKMTFPEFCQVQLEKSDSRSLYLYLYPFQKDIPVEKQYQEIKNGIFKYPAERIDYAYNLYKVIIRMKREETQPAYLSLWRRIGNAIRAFFKGEHS